MLFDMTPGFGGPVGEGLGTEGEPSIVEASGLKAGGEGGSVGVSEDVVGPVDFLIDGFFEEGFGEIGEISIKPTITEAVVVEEAVYVVVTGDFVNKVVGALLNPLVVGVHHEGDLVL